MRKSANSGEKLRKVAGKVGVFWKICGGFWSYVVENYLGKGGNVVGFGASLPREHALVGLLY